MKTLNAIISLGFACVLCSCINGSGSSNLGYHQIKVAWAPGYENVPECKSLIVMQANSVDISGVNVPIPQAGTSVTVGGVKIDAHSLQNASDAAIQADQKYTRLCSLLPSYSNNQVAFYKARDQMFDLISGTQQIASAVASTTGQPQPAPALTVPTAAPAAAATAGANAAKAVAQPASTPAPPVNVAANAQAKPVSPAATRKLNSLAEKLKEAVAKKLPKTS